MANPSFFCDLKSHFSAKINSKKQYEKAKKRDGKDSIKAQIIPLSNKGCSSSLQTTSWTLSRAKIYVQEFSKRPQV